MIRRALLAAPVLVVVALGSRHASAQVIPTIPTTTTGPPSTTAPSPPTTAKAPATSGPTTPTSARPSTTRGSTTTRPPATLPPVKPQPTVTTAADVSGGGPSGSISPFFPWLSGTGFATALGLLGTNWFRHRKR